MAINEQLLIKFFVSKTSLSYQEDMAHFQSLLNDLKDVMPITGRDYKLKPEIICVEDHPKATKEYNITGLPLLMIHQHQFQGISNLTKIVEVLRTSEVIPSDSPH